MWEEEWAQLPEKDREQFADTINNLLQSTFVVREVIDAREKTTIINRQYRFIERHHRLIHDYLGFIGWDVRLDNAYGVAAAINLRGQGPVRLDKFTTYMLYCLRLIYEEGRERLSLRKDVGVNVGAVIEKMFHLGLLDRKPADKQLQDSLIELRGYAILDKVDGGWTDPETRLVIYPSILFLVSNEKVQQLYSSLARDGQENDGETIVSQGILGLIAATEERGGSNADA